MIHWLSLLHHPHLQRQGLPMEWADKRKESTHRNGLGYTCCLHKRTYVCAYALQTLIWVLRFTYVRMFIHCTDTAHTYVRMYMCTAQIQHIRTYVHVYCTTLHNTIGLRMSWPIHTATDITSSALYCTYVPMYVHIFNKQWPCPNRTCHHNSTLHDTHTEVAKGFLTLRYTCRLGTGPLRVEGRVKTKALSKR